MAYIPHFILVPLPAALKPPRALRLAGLLSLFLLTGANAETASLRISFGHQSRQSVHRSIRLLPGSPGLQITTTRSSGSDTNGTVTDRIQLRAGAGIIATIECDVHWPPVHQRSNDTFPFDYNGNAMWKYLFEHGTPGQVARLKDDPAFTPGSPIMTIETAADGTEGFSIGILQLLRHRALWLPERDAFVTLADAPIGFEQHLASLEGERTLDRVQREPEPTLADFTALWEDMGNPDAWNKPWEVDWLGTRGHIIPLAGQHGSLYKFGIDRRAAVRPDRASPHQFRLDLIWPNSRWAGQRLTDGLPVIVTDLNREGQRCDIEQFAAPRERAIAHPRGESPMALFSRVTFSGASSPLEMTFRLATESKERLPELVASSTPGVRLPGWRVVDRETGRIWLTLEPEPGLVVQSDFVTSDSDHPRIDIRVTGAFPPGRTSRILLKLLSPPAPPEALDSVLALDFDAERSAALAYWESWLDQGARFVVPEPKVNELFRANLWHGLRLPRFREQDGQDRIDLPYSNFAYGQLNADWPINQAVYVDYGLYGLRGHFTIAEEEFAAMFHTQQRDNGRVGGYADWGVYTPSMLYSIGHNFLLSRDRASFDRLLPAALDAMDWCLDEIDRSQSATNTPGLIVAPLNDLTHDVQAWAFPNAYFVAGLSTFGKALEAYGHSRANECLTIASRMRHDVERAFARASVRSPVVQLADGTWNNYVPCAATTTRRLFDQWYPTDVDTGPLHLARLEAIDPRGWLAAAMLHDHEDNLFLNQWGAANEPVYNQQGTVYLLRDEPEAAIRTFYTTMACAFSHGQLEPVEHRWAWGQYFGPPSTDGAWFHLYRHLLIRETDPDTLLLGQAIPRTWLEDGKRIVIERAPTYHGQLSLTIESRVASDEIRAVVQLSDRNPPAVLLVRLRHPARQSIRSVSINGREWSDFDPLNEWVRVPAPTSSPFELTTRY